MAKENEAIKDIGKRIFYIIDGTQNEIKYVQKGNKTGLPLTEDVKKALPFDSVKEAVKYISAMDWLEWTIVIDNEVNYYNFF
jgi:hypothetical protein